MTEVKYGHKVNKELINFEKFISSIIMSLHVNKNNLTKRIPTKR